MKTFCLVVSSVWMIAQAVGTMDIWSWLVQQLPVVVVMGIVIYIQRRDYVKERDRNNELSDKVVELTTIWERKVAEQEQQYKGKEDEVKGALGKIEILLTEIRGLVQK